MILKNLRETRIECNLTQKEIAALIGISQQSYSDYENGKTEPDFCTLIKIAEILDVTVDYLIGRSDELGNVAAMPPAAPALAEDERRLLECYRALEPDYKRLAIDTLGTWSGNPTKKGKTSRA